MNINEAKLIKILLTSALVVGLAFFESKLKHKLEGIDGIYLPFILFLMSLFLITIIEVVFEKLDDSDWFSRVFSGRDYILGWWLNYAEDRDKKIFIILHLLKFIYVMVNLI